MPTAPRVAATALGLMLAMSFGAAAEGSAAGDLGELRAQQLSLREAVEAGDGLFKDMGAPQRAELASRQTELLTLIDGKQTAGDLDQETRAAAYALLQQINATVNDAEKEQVVCRSTREIGSNRKVRHCTPVADRSREREEALRILGPPAIGS